MGIQTLTIHTLSTGGSAFIAEGLHHVKALPGLSVVQSLRGRYEVALDGGPSFFTSEGGCFIAPSPVSYTHLDVYKRQVKAASTQRRSRSLSIAIGVYGGTAVKNPLRRALSERPRPVRYAPGSLPQRGMHDGK